MSPFRDGVKKMRECRKEVQSSKFKEMNEMKYKGMNRGLKLNPESLSRIFGNLHVYSNMVCIENTTPAGVGQSLGVCHFSTTNPPRLNDEVGQALIPTLQRGTKRAQTLSFRLTILNLTKLNAKEKERQNLMNQKLKI